MRCELEIATGRPARTLQALSSEAGARRIRRRATPFSIDRSGGVHHATSYAAGLQPARSRTLLLLERAQPLPPPPAEIHGSQIAVVVPIRYNIK
jgi:protein TonB